MTLFDNAYRGRRVLLTGHTGFKGSWMATWLRMLGAEVTGFALPPATTPNHWDLIGAGIADRRGDIRDAAAVRQAVVETQPEVVFHLAAQALVRRSYRDPLESWSTNVMGTANLIDACRGIESVRAIVVITTDKVYLNREWAWGYRETDELGGHDAYSASKAASEIVAASYRKAFLSQPGAPLLATARAGNVIGGGDWSEDRLIPDLVRAIGSGGSVEIRSPQATRPWQHVLETIAGYLRLGQLLLAGRSDVATAWNFGPSAADNRTVGEVLTLFQSLWPELRWHLTGQPQPHEANLLYLDSSAARAGLGWSSVWELGDALARTADWYRAHMAGAAIPTAEQIERYASDARSAGCPWA